MICRQSLQHYYRDTAAVSSELRGIIQKNAEKLKLKSSKTLSTDLRRLCSPAFWRPFSSVGVLYALSHLDGFGVILVYVVELFRDARMRSVDPLAAHIGVYVVRVAASALSPAVMRRTKVTVQSSLQ